MHRAAIRIIEGGNLLTVPGRDVAPPGTKSETPGVEVLKEPAGVVSCAPAFERLTRRVETT